MTYRAVLKEWLNFGTSEYMTEPEPAYTTIGEVLPPDTVERLRRDLLGIRSDSISEVRRCERMLEAIGHPVESAVRQRASQRRRGHLTNGRR
jgi:hypothetical protein